MRCDTERTVAWLLGCRRLRVRYDRCDEFLSVLRGDDDFIIMGGDDFIIMGDDFIIMGGDDF